MRVDNSVWLDYRFSSLCAEAKAVYLFLITGPQAKSLEYNLSESLAAGILGYFSDPNGIGSFTEQAKCFCALMKEISDVDLATYEGYELKIAPADFILMGDAK